MEITKFKILYNKKKRGLICKNCIYLQVEKGYVQIYVNDDKNWKKWVESISFFCKFKGKYVRRDKSLCGDKQTVTLEAYT